MTQSLETEVADRFSRLHRTYCRAIDELALLQSDLAAPQPSELAPTQLSVVLARLRDNERLFRETLSLWQSPDFKPTSATIALKDKVQQSLELLLQRVATCEQLAADYRHRLAPQLTAAAREKAATDTYQRMSR